MRAWRAVGAVSLALLVAGAATAAGSADESAPASTSTTTVPTAITPTTPLTTTTTSPTTPATPSSPPGLELVWIGNFNQPVGIVGAPGNEGRLFVVERTGEIALLSYGQLQPQPFLSIRNLVGSKHSGQGLLGLAFSPDYSRNRLFYVDYTMPNGDIRVAQFTRLKTNPDLANPRSERVVLTISPTAGQDDNGGDLAFGPDGDLYISVGDGDSSDDPADNGQNTDTLLGKILRIRPRVTGGYSVPRSNPFVGKAGKQPQIWAYGLHNPSFSFDPPTGALTIGDLGSGHEDEIDYAPKGGRGANYGWPIWEADQRNQPGVVKRAVLPVLELPHSEGYCGVVGGYVERDPTAPALDGQYLFGDRCRQPIMAVTLTPGHATDLHAIGLNVANASSFGEDAAGHVYVASLAGPVYEIVQASQG